ncbi:hypothetical protein Q8A73_007442 [Channa argus]|nr:hypothetical protein Q8A73_007442 [Channa argus]
MSSIPFGSTVGRHASVLNDTHMSEISVQHRASEHRHREVAELLLRCATDVHCPSKFDNVPFNISTDTADDTATGGSNEDRSGGGHNERRGRNSDRAEETTATTGARPRVYESETPTTATSAKYSAEKESYKTCTYRNIVTASDTGAPRYVRSPLSVRENLYSIYDEGSQIAAGHLVAAYGCLYFSGLISKFSLKVIWVLRALKTVWANHQAEPLRLPQRARE